jgi:hypothetical protein
MRELLRTPSLRSSQNSSSRDCLENSLRVLDRLCLLASRERDETFSPCFGYSLHSESRPIGTFQTVSPRTPLNRGKGLYKK